jgi:hypothetical protein
MKSKLKYPPLVQGSDPELFVKSLSQGRFVSALDVLGQNKDNPIYTRRREKLYADGLAIEGTVTPTRTKNGFVKAIAGFINDARHILGKDFVLSNTASTVFDEDQFNHPEARILGCNSALDVFAKRSVVPTPGSEKQNMRSCGGHIHFSSFNPNGEFPQEKTLMDFDVSQQFIKLLNLIVATALNVVDNDPTSKNRRILYGKAGEFRPTDYGCEMRSPSNYWLGNEDLVKLVYDLSHFAYDILMTEKGEEYLGKIDEKRLVSAINDFDKNECWAILEEIKLPKRFLKKISELAAEKIALEENWA